MPKRAPEHELLSLLFEHRTSFEDGEYLAGCSFAHAVYETRRLGMEVKEATIDRFRTGAPVPLGNSGHFPRCVADIRRSATRSLRQLDDATKEHIAWTVDLLARKRSERSEETLLLGTASTHGGSANANTTDLVYRNVRSTRARPV
jgi:hypothetical protein